jgi:hypothetical protein
MKSLDQSSEMEAKSKISQEKKAARISGHDK